jgi:DNA-binding NarL/FixJ family response regulator
MRKIRVLVADDHALVRSGLRLLIDAQEDMEVVGEAGAFAQMVDQLESLEPDLLTLDLAMPGGFGVAGIEKLRSRFPQLRIVVLTMYDDPAIVRTALAMGAAGYVAKSAADTGLINAIRAVHDGRVFVDAQNMSETSQRIGFGKPGSVPAPIEKLSHREREVLALIANGLTNQAAADQLGLSVKTVESYRARLMEKLELKNRADLTRLAIECGLLQSTSSLFPEPPSPPIA